MPVDYADSACLSYESIDDPDSWWCTYSDEFRQLVKDSAEYARWVITHG